MGWLHLKKILKLMIIKEGLKRLATSREPFHSPLR